MRLIKILFGAKTNTAKPADIADKDNKKKLAEIQQWIKSKKEANSDIQQSNESEYLNHFNTDVTSTTKGAVID